MLSYITLFSTEFGTGKKQNSL